MDYDNESIGKLVERALISIQDAGIVQDKIGLEDTALLGRPKGPLDSLALVALIAELEEAVEAELGVVVSLAAGLGSVGEQSPFGTVGSLKHYVADLVRQATV
jgi:acyl carrier protein